MGQHGWHELETHGIMEGGWFGLGFGRTYEKIWNNERVKTYGEPGTLEDFEGGSYAVEQMAY